MLLRKPEEVKAHSLELNETFDLHKKGWMIQRIGWVLMLVFVICAACGLFGNGAASREIKVAGANSVEYEYYGRYDAETEIKVHLNSMGDIAQLSIPQHYFDKMELEKMIPEAELQQVMNGNNVYSFAADKPFEVTLYIKPKKVGKIEAWFGLNNAAAQLIHFIYP